MAELGQSPVLRVTCQVCPGPFCATLTLFAVTVCCSPWIRAEEQAQGTQELNAGLSVELNGTWN